MPDQCMHNLVMAFLTSHPKSFVILRRGIDAEHLHKSAEDLDTTEMGKIKPGLLSGFSQQNISHGSDHRHEAVMLAMILFSGHVQEFLAIQHTFVHKKRFYDLLLAISASKA